MYDDQLSHWKFTNQSLPRSQVSVRRESVRRSVLGLIMISHIARQFGGLFSCFVFRLIALGATGIWLSLTAADAPAQSVRRYQMSNIPTTEGSTTVDIPIFHWSHTQPA